jgi:hypothetical protein
MTKKTNSRTKNALVHGTYSSDIVLPWEKAEDFYELLKGIREEFTPQGTTENRIVFDLAHLYWKKARVNRLTQLLVRQTPVAAQIVASGKRTIKGICAHLDAPPVDKNDGLDVSLKQADMLSSIIPDLKIAEEEKNRFLGMIELFQKVIADVRRPKSFMGGALSSLVDELAKCVELESRLDGMIDRTIQRLAAAKEFKRIYAPAVLIASKPVKDIDNDNDNDNDDAGIRRRDAERQRKSRRR